MILEKTSCPRGYRMTIYSMGKDAHKEKWEGARTSTDDIVMHFKADDAQSIAQFPSALKNLSSAFSNIYLDIPSSSTLSRRGRTLSHKSMLKVSFVSPMFFVAKAIGDSTWRLELLQLVWSMTVS